MRRQHVLFRVQSRISRMIFFSSFLAAVQVLAPSHAWAKKYPHGWEHADPPTGDEFLTNRFGRSWGEPITNGYLIVDGQYIDAPYVVEQRGFVIFVNDVRVGDGVDVRLVLPLPEPPPVTEDPGLPTNLTANSTAAQALMDPMVGDKRRYWSHIGMRGDDRVRKEIEFFSSLPCIERVEEEKGPPDATERRIVLWDRKGNSTRTTLSMIPILPPPLPSDERAYSSITSGPPGVERALRTGRLLLVRNGSIVAEDDRPQPTERWKKIFEILSGNLSGEERLAALKDLEFVERFRTLESAEGFYPVTYFKPTDQLWKRLSGDESWRKDAEAMLARLTNGWVRIPPRFQRQAAAIETPRPPPTVPDSASESPRRSPERSDETKAGKPAPESPLPVPPSPEAPSGAFLPLVALLGIVLVVLIAIVLFRRRSS